MPHFGQLTHILPTFESDDMVKMNYSLLFITIWGGLKMKLQIVRMKIPLSNDCWSCPILS